MKHTLSVLAAVIISLFYSLADAQQLYNNEYRKLNNVLGAVNSLYVDSVNEKKLVEAAITAALKELDPHSSYIPKEEVERVNEPLEGSFEGVGIQFQLLEDTLLVIQTISGCPAEKVGVQPGDRIIYINDELIAGVSLKNSDVMKRLRGQKGTEVTVKIKRGKNKELLTFRIIRDKIPIHSVDASYMIGKDIGYIKINNFGSNTVQEYLKAFEDLKKAGMKHLILSLQGNGGGYLNAAIQLADEFLERNRLIVYTEGLHQPKSVAEATAIGGFEKGWLVVLIDEYSASASEIVSGALQDWDRALIVGRRSFGKGLVQRQIPMFDGSMLRLTTARYYTPSGRCIQKSYKDGSAKYEEDIANRLKKGELLHADSIHFPDSLKYETKVMKRTVYGGGGIMPDIFIPMDTTKYTDFQKKTIALGLVNKLIAQYIEVNREKLKKDYPEFAKFKSGFTPDATMMLKLKSMAEAEKIKVDSVDFEKSKDYLNLQFKALIARDMWSSNELYQIIDAENESLQEAVRILQTPGLYYQTFLNKSKKQ